MDSSSKSSNSSDSEESGESETLEDRQFRREMDEYDTIMAKGHKIAKRELRRQELDGMEGIKRSSSTAIGQIMGDSEAQGPVFSPRKTRSGRVFEYSSEK